MKLNNKIVYYAENQVEADMICNLFKEYDIPVQQLQESAGKTIGLQFGILGEIAISVPEERAAEAEGLLLDLDNPIPDDKQDGSEK